MNNETCPKCGAGWAKGTTYTCGTISRAQENRADMRGDKCYERQLAQRDAEIERLKQAFKTYGWHTEDCDSHVVSCTCGFDEVK